MNAQWIGGHFVLTYSTAKLETVVRVFDRMGNNKQTVEFPEAGTMTAWTGGSGTTESYFSFSGFHTPPTAYRYSFDMHHIQSLNTPTVPVDLTQVVSELNFAVSADGTRVPFQLIYRKGAEKKTRFIYYYIYGSYGVGAGSILPLYSAKYLTVLEMGGAVVVANVRGGGEGGEAWHQGGIRKNKQNMIDDAVAVADWLIHNEWTKPRQVSLYGRSGGGLNSALLLTKRPDLFGSASPTASVTDLLRYQWLSPVSYRWHEEYGTASTPEEARFLRLWSPYHLVSSKKHYPPTMVFAAEKDDRAGPANAYKFVARLQFLRPSDPIYLWTQPNAGHFYRGETLNELSFIGRVYNIDTLTELK